MVRRDTVCCDALNFGIFFSPGLYYALSHILSVFSIFFFLFHGDGLQLMLIPIYYFLEVFGQIADQLCKRNTLRIYNDN